MLASSVDRARSANRTVTTLRSATSSAASSPACSPARPSTGLPQLGQNRAPSGSGVPHHGQVISSTEVLYGAATAGPPGGTPGAHPGGGGGGFPPPRGGAGPPGAGGEAREGGAP